MGSHVVNIIKRYFTLFAKSFIVFGGLMMMTVTCSYAEGKYIWLCLTDCDGLLGRPYRTSGMSSTKLRKNTTYMVTDPIS